MTVSIGFVRKEDVSLEITILANITEDQLLEGLTSGEYEITESDKMIINVSTGDTVAKIVDWSEDDLTHCNFELI